MNGIKSSVPKDEFLPTISAFYLYHKQLNENAFDFQSENSVGIQLNMPLFTSGQNLSKVKQAKLELDKARNDTWIAQNGLILEYERAKSDFFYFS
ncbi:MAG: TolC family protein [Bacteroidales bacterium]|nr:TolC family protein [Bacteroidales bacterium]